MPSKKTKPSRRSLKLCLHRPSGRAYVRIDGTVIYLGAYGDEATEQRFYQLVAEWKASGCRRPVPSAEITVCELTARYLAFCADYYRAPDGKLSGEADNVRCATRPLLKLYADAAAVAFGPMALKAVRMEMIGRGWSRRNINGQIGRIKRLFRWATENELIPPQVFHALQTVPGLKMGRSAARETGRVLPVALEHVDRVKRLVSRQVAAMIDLQLLTAARPGELCILRPMDFDTSGPVWIATPRDHKNAYREQKRALYFGPKAQAVIKPFMLRAPDAYLFSPREAEKERYAAAGKHRRTGQKPNQRITERTVGVKYSTLSYGRAITRVCGLWAEFAALFKDREANEARIAELAEILKTSPERKPEPEEIPNWTPHRLRHAAATQIRKEFGLEASQLILGHAKADVTQLYAEINEGKALEIAAKIG